MLPYDCQAARAPGWAHRRGLLTPAASRPSIGALGCPLYGEARALGPVLANVTPGSLQFDFPGQTLTLFF